MLTKNQYDSLVAQAEKREDDLMDAIHEALKRKRQEAMAPLPNYQDVIRHEYIKALNQAKERPVLDLDDLSC